MRHARDNERVPHDLVFLNNLLNEEKKILPNYRKHNYVRIVSFCLNSFDHWFSIGFKTKGQEFYLFNGSAVDHSYKFPLEFAEILEISVCTVDPLPNTPALPASKNSLVLEFGYDPSIPEFL